MAVKLKKGQKVDLKKDNGDSLRHVVVGLGWDPVEQPAKGGFFGLFAPKPPEIDCDASVFMLKNGHLAGKQDVVYYGNLKHLSGAVQHMGDNLTGGGDGDDEQITLDLSAIPAEYDRIIFTVTIYHANEREQHFGLINNAFIRIVDQDTRTEMCRFDLTDNYQGKTAMIFGEVYRRDGAWKFNAIGEGTMDSGLASLTKRYS